MRRGQTSHRTRSRHIRPPHSCQPMLPARGRTASPSPPAHVQWARLHRPHCRPHTHTFCLRPHMASRWAPPGAWRRVCSKSGMAHPVSQDWQPPGTNPSPCPPPILHHHASATAASLLQATRSISPASGGHPDSLDARSSSGEKACRAATAQRRNVERRECLFPPRCVAGYQFGSTHTTSGWG
jgi:hypothetical protein